MKRAAWIAGVALSAAVLTAAAGGTAWAQQEFGEITEREWQLQAPSDYREANALVIFDRIYVIGATGEERRHIRYKVLNKQGIEDVGEREFSYSKREHLEDLKAQTVLPGGQAIAVAQSDFHTRKVGDRINCTFAFPQADSGCILEYSYRLWGGGWMYSDYRIFSHAVYTLETEFALEVGVGLQYQFRTRNVPLGKRDPVVVKLPGAEMKAKQKFIWELTNLPPIDDDEPYRGFWADFVPSLTYTYSSMERKATNQDAMDKWRDIGQVWEAHLNEYIGKPRDFKPFVRGLIKGLDSSYQKSKALYDWVVGEIATRQDDFSDNFHHDGIGDLLKAKYGTSGEKNLLLLEMLRTAGVKAWPILICTRDYAKFDPTWLGADQFTHAIVFAEVEQGGIYLDATSKYNTYGTLPPVCRTDIGLLLDGDKSELVKITTGEPASNRIDMVTYRLDQAGNASCSTSVMCTGYLTAAYGRAYETTEPDEYLDDDILGITHDGYKRGTFEATLDSLHRFRVVTGYTVEGAARSMEENLVVDMPPGMFSRNPFRNKRRTFPINFNYPYTYQSIVQIVGPDGSVAASAPPDTAFMVDGLLYERHCSADGSMVQIRNSLKVGKPLFEVDEYPDLREFFVEVEKASAEKVVFTMTGGQ